MLLCYSSTKAQEASNELPFRSIPDYPSQYTANTIVARMIDGLGFRYYWATEGLRAEDLNYAPNETARTTEETLDHILGLCLMTSHTIQQIPNERFDALGLTFAEKRKLTLEKLQIASEILKNNPEVSPENYPISEENPFWRVTDNFSKNKL